MNFNLSESQVQDVISQWLSLNKIVHWRQNSGAMLIHEKENHFSKTKKRFIRFIRFIFILYPRQNDLKFTDLAGICEGIHFVIECKKPGKKPNKEQQNFINLISEEKGLALWADSLQTVIDEFKKFFPDKKFAS